MTEPKFTKGPWAWFGDAGSNSLYLATNHSGRRYVMKFRRWGFSGAQPVFQPVDRMVEAKNLLKFEVGDRSVTGIDEAKKNTSVYRTDICGIEAPDAHLIAAAPELYEALERILHDLQSLKENSEGVSGLHLNGDVADWDSLSEGGQFSPWLGDAENIACAALAKARGETP